jgi:ABC-type phosphate transport system substrate-binding protein
MKYANLLLVVAVTSVAAASCNWAKQKAKDTVNKTGEVVARTGSEFVNGVSKGVEKTFQNEVVFSDRLKSQGLKTGKIVIRGTDTSIDNILSVYFVFDDNFDQDITIKVISEAGQEYGRVTQHVKGNKGSAGFTDFVFDKRTDIDGRGKLIFE